MRLAAITVLSILNCACAVPGQHFKPQAWVEEPLAEQAAADFQLNRLTAEVIARHSQPAPVVAANPELDAALRSYEYRIGPRDILIFTVWDHPELTIPAGEFRSPEIQGHLVSPDGDIFFPYVGSVRVAGMTLADVRESLTGKLGRYIQNPQLDVRIAGFRSKRINVTGQVALPGFFPVTDTPITLVDAINLAGGSTEYAAIQRVQVVRAGEALTFDVMRLLQQGDLSQNMLLRDGDVVFVPRNDFYVAHVMGSIDKPGVIPIVEGRLNLAEAINLSGGLVAVEADASKIFVFRHHRDGPEVFWLDARSADAMILATQFPLQPQDVVFVASSTMARWNRVVSQVLPTIQSLWQTQAFIDNLND